MDLLQLFSRRASVRRFSKEPLRPGDLDKLLWAAQRAPTDATAQLYSLLRVTDPQLRAEIGQLANNNAHVTEAAEFFLVLADLYRVRQLVEHSGAAWGHWPRTGVHFAITDAVLAGSAMAIMAESLGYGICWIGGVLNGMTAIAQKCQLPPEVLMVAGLCVGVPDEDPAPRPRLERGLVVHQNTYQRPQPGQLDQAMATMAPITRSGDWAALLQRYFAAGGTMTQREQGYQWELARQGLEPDLPAPLLQTLGERGVQPGSLGQLIEATFAAGFRSVVFRPGEVWIESEPSAFRGEGQPGVALTQALLEGLEPTEKLPG